jgi:hypothetical protein
VSVDACIPCCSSQVFAISVGDVYLVRAFVALSQAKINDVDAVFSCFIPAYQEVVWLDVSVDNAFIVDFLYALQLQ